MFINTKKKKDASIFEVLYSHFSHKSPFLTQYFNLTSKNNGKTQLVKSDRNHTIFQEGIWFDSVDSVLLLRPEFFTFFQKLSFMGKYFPRAI